MEFIIPETNRGKKCLLHDGYVYPLDAVLKNQDSSWKYSNKNCRARLKTNHDGSTIIPVKMDHNHDGDDRKVERKQLIMAVKRKAVMTCFRDLQNSLEVSYIISWMNSYSHLIY